MPIKHLIGSKLDLVTQWQSKADLMKEERKNASTRDWMILDAKITILEECIDDLRALRSTKDEITRMKEELNEKTIIR